MRTIQALKPDDDYDYLDYDNFTPNAETGEVEDENNQINSINPTIDKRLEDYSVDINAFRAWYEEKRTRRKFNERVSFDSRETIDPSTFEITKKLKRTTKLSKKPKRQDFHGSQNFDDFGNSLKYRRDEQVEIDRELIDEGIRNYSNSDTKSYEHPAKVTNESKSTEFYRRIFEDHFGIVDDGEKRARVFQINNVKHLVDAQLEEMKRNGERIIITPEEEDRIINERCTRKELALRETLRKITPDDRFKIRGIHSIKLNSSEIDQLIKENIQSACDLLEGISQNELNDLIPRVKIAIESSGSDSMVYARLQDDEVNRFFKELKNNHEGSYSDLTLEIFSNRLINLVQTIYEKNDFPRKSELKKWYEIYQIYVSQFEKRKDDGSKKDFSEEINVKKSYPKNNFVNDSQMLTNTPASKRPEALSRFNLKKRGFSNDILAWEDVGDYYIVCLYNPKDTNRYVMIDKSRK